MAHNYTIQFKSLRSATVYTLAIGGGTGDAIPLTPGAQPFTTQEDDNEDVFTPVRTQSGYLRVVDDGKDANGNAWDWKDLIPATDTSRPVTLTHMIPNPDAGQEGEPDEIEMTDWVGFMQAQTFSGVLYGNPQEREFPVQCPLAVTEGTDINYTQTEVKNFAYLLKQVVDSIPSGARPTSFVIQGGADAQGWLLKQIDWMNFVNIDADENLSARYSMFQCLEDMCRFWGWTVRVHRQTLYMTCADDTDENTFLTLTTEQLATIAGGTAAGTTNTAYTETTLPTDAFCNIDNYDFVIRGYNEAVVQADANGGDEHMLQYADSEMVKEMERQTWSQPVTDGDKLVSYTLDILSFTRPLVTLTATENYGSFNIAKIQDSARDEGENINVMRIKKSYANAAPASIAVQTKYEHCFSNGYLVIRGSTYRLATLFEDVSDSDRSLGITTGGILNMILDPIFIFEKGTVLFGFLTLPFGFGLGTAGAAIATVLAQVGLSGYGSRKPSELSGGQKQRIAIAGVIAMEPKCIVLDEPTAMLDPKGRREVIDTIRKLNADKKITVVLITHHMDEAAKAQRVVVLHKGKVAADGSPSEVFSQVELLHRIGLAAPDTVELCWELNKLGFSLPLSELSIEDCAQALYDAVKA